MRGCDVGSDRYAIARSMSVYARYRYPAGRIGVALRAQAMSPATHHASTAKSRASAYRSLPTLCRWEAPSA